MMTYEELIKRTQENFTGNAAALIDSILCDGEDIPGKPDATRFWIPSKYYSVFGTAGSIIEYGETTEDDDYIITGYELY